MPVSSHYLHVCAWMLGCSERFDYGRVSHLKPSSFLRQVATTDRRGYLTRAVVLFVLPQCHRMSDAVEGAEVVIYCVSKDYKESSNCRLGAMLHCFHIALISSAYVSTCVTCCKTAQRLAMLISEGEVTFALSSLVLSQHNP